MDVARIAVLLEPFLDHPLSSRALDQISIYIDLLLRWNARVNLTAIRDPEHIVTRHFGESLFLARQLFPRGQPPQGHVSQGHASQDRASHESTRAPSIAASAITRVIDIGSGAGFPGLPLKIWHPEMHLRLIESNHKKAAFLREVVRALTFINIDVIAERAEVLAAAGRPSADVVTLRAVERFEEILPTAARFLAPAGRLALLIGAGQTAALSDLLPSLRWSLPVPIPLAASTVIVIGSPHHSGPQ